MKRKTLLIAAGFVLLAVIILAVYFINTPKQTVSYKKSMLTDNISSFETAEKTAMALYEDGNERIILLAIMAMNICSIR